MSLFAELKRRNVFRVGIAYLVATWLLVEASTVLLEGFGAPEWVPKTVAALLALGFPIALFFAWAFELTAEGIKREKDVDRSASVTHQTAKRLDVVTIALVAVALVAFLTESWWRPETGVATPGDQASAQSAVDTLSVAVLPFTNMSADAENEYFADGISEEILNLLSSVRDLEVASRTSAFAFKGKDTPIPQIAATLKVRYVLEGSVRKAGDQVRITAQLIDADTDRHLWSDSYDRTLEDIFAVQDEIAGAIGTALQVELLGASGEAVTAETLDPALYAQFLEARYLLRRRSEEALIRAAAMLEEVVAAEPDFPRGLSLLAESYLLRSGDLEESEWEQVLVRARELSMRALELDPDLATAYMIQASLAGQENDKLGAYRAYQKAIELEPEEPRPHHWLAIVYSQAGYVDLALASINEALRLEPDNANANGWRATVLMTRGEYPEAVAAATLQAELGNPAYGHYQAGFTYVMAGDLEAAAEAYVRGDRVTGNDPEGSRLILAVAADPAAGDAMLDYIARGETRRLPYENLFALAALGLHDAFLDAVVQADGSLNSARFGLPTVVWSEQNQPMRADPRFIQLMEAEGITELWRELGPPPDCRAEGDSFTCGHGN